MKHVVMNIVISNDDGFLADGINCLRHALQPAHHIITVAPDRDRSGVSNALTLDRPLRVTKRGDDFYSINGTPTDCVHLAVTGDLFPHTPDVVISGINHGPNLGDDVLYSGTVAAAMEGRFLGYPALAVSINSHHPQYLDSAAQAIQHVLPRLRHYPNQGNLILNINVPDLPWEQIKGFQVTRLGQRHKAEPVIKSHDPRGKPIYWVGAVGHAADAGEGTDFHAVESGYISISPVQHDLTHYNALDSTREWLDNKT